MKKILALVLALALVMMVGSAAFAADTYSGSVTVTGLDKGDEAYFYKIIEWVGETKDPKTDVTGWRAVSTYAEVLDTATLTEVLLGTPKANTDPVEYENPTGITPELAGLLAKKAASGTKVDVGDEKTASLTGLTAPGTYMVLVKPADVNTVYNPIFVSADYTTTAGSQAASNYDDGETAATSTTKKSTLTLTKTAETDEDTWDDGKSYSTAVGDTVNFTVTATIPAYGEVYTNPYFAIKDTLTDLTLDTTSIKVDNAPSSENWEVKSATGSGYVIEFKPTYLKTIKTATVVTVTYSATVATSAVKAINEETNDVMIEYSHDPSNESDHDVKKDTTQHYTFTLDAAGLGAYQTYSGTYTSELVKIGLDSNGQPINKESEPIYSAISTDKYWEGPLAGAVFGLYTDNKCEHPYVPNGTTEGLTATTMNDGRMTFAGLDAGTYYLKEISAPAGFVANTTVHTIVISAAVEKITVTEYYKDGVWSSTSSEGAKAATYETEVLSSYTVTVDDVQTAIYTFTNDKETTDNDIQWTNLGTTEVPSLFTNEKGVELPSTGGIGTTIFYILGGLLVVGAVVILVARRKAQD